jgi:hypothetical protein
MNEVLDEAKTEIENMIDHFRTMPKDEFYGWFEGNIEFVEHFIAMRLNKELENEQRDVKL